MIQPVTGPGGGNPIDNPEIVADFNKLISAINAGIVARGGSAARTLASYFSDEANVQNFGPLNSVDNTATLNAALAAAQAYMAVVNCTVVIEMPSGVIPISGIVTVPAGVGLKGTGGSIDASAGTRILCTAAGAQLVITGSGGSVSDFVVDGNAIAVLPMLDFKSVGRYFESINVINAAGHNWVIQYSQNNQYNKCQSQGASGRGLVLDLGCGGLLFCNFEANSCGAGSMLTQQSGVTPLPYYAKPTHVTFLHSIFERQAADVHAVEMSDGEALYFDHCVMTDNGLGTAAASVIYAHGTAHAAFFSCRVFDTGAAQTAIQLSDSAQLFFSGLNELFTSGGIDIDTPGGTRLTIAGAIVPPGGRAYLTYAAGNVPDATAFLGRLTGEVTSRQNAGDLANGTAVATEAGQRFRQTADGSMHWGSGAGFTFDTAWARLSAGVLGPGAGGSVKVDGTWNGGMTIMGTNYLWVDSTGRLRIKNGAPTSDIDGVVVGTQS